LKIVAESALPMCAGAVTLFTIRHHDFGWSIASMVALGLARPMAEHAVAAANRHDGSRYVFEWLMTLERCNLEGEGPTVGGWEHHRGVQIDRDRTHLFEYRGAYGVAKCS
jgi:hypothetical protein